MTIINVNPLIGTVQYLEKYMNNPDMGIYFQWRDSLVQQNEESKTTVLLVGKTYYPLTSDYRFSEPIIVKGHMFDSVERAYKWLKYSLNIPPQLEQNMLDEQKHFLKECLDPKNTPVRIRELERLIPIKHRVISGAWLSDNSKCLSQRKQIMLMLTYQKCLNNPDVFELLSSTKMKIIIAPSFAFSRDGRKWGDRIWEVEYDKNGKIIKGQNFHGDILMTVRNMIM